MHNILNEETAKTQYLDTDKNNQKTYKTNGNFNEVYNQILDSDSDKSISAASYYPKGIDSSTMASIMRSNGLPTRQNISNNQYTKFSKFGYMDPYHDVSSNREFVFFTKPDLNIFGGDDELTPSNVTASESSLNPKLAEASTLFTSAVTRYFPVLKQLQYNADRSTPFMCLMSNRLRSSLELPGISSDSNESASNVYGTVIKYRGSSIKSDQDHNFTLSFTDSKYLELYMLAKLYDEYHRLTKLGRINPKKEYIKQRILDDQFSAYKFVVGEDAETLLYWAKITGIFITDVPRSDLSEFPQDGIKFSLSFYGHFIKDMDPVILTDFNRLTSIAGKKEINTFKRETGLINNAFVSTPHIIPVVSDTLRRNSDHLGNKEYKLKWYD